MNSVLRRFWVLGLLASFIGMPGVVLAQSTGTFTVYKEYSDSNDAVVNIRLVCTNGTDTTLPTISGEAEFTGISPVYATDANFQYTPTTCTATETTNAAGYYADDTLCVDEVFEPVIAQIQGGTASGSCTITNTIPHAVDDEKTVLEDDPATTIDVLLNDEYLNGAIIGSVTQPSNGTVEITNAGADLTYEPDANYCNDDGDNPVTTDDFTYTLDPASIFDPEYSTATVEVTVTCVNDPPEVSVSPASQTADYSDNIGTVTITATDVDSPPLSDGGADLTLTVDGDGSGFADADLIFNSCTFDDPGQTCTWTMDGQVLVPGDNVYDIDFTANDGEFDSDDADCSDVATPCRHELTVEPEDATVALSAENYTALQVVSDGGLSGPFELFFSSWETNDPDNAHGGTAEFGDLNLMEPKLVLKPVGPGGSVNGSCAFITPLPIYEPEIVSEGYNQLALFECTFDAVPVNVYEVLASVEGLSATTTYYRGADEDMLSVFDPSLGFTTGGGWFYWPDTAIPADACLDEVPPVEPAECITPDPCAGLYAGDKTNFGWNMKYNKPRTKLQGSLLVMRHTEPTLVDGYCEPTDSYKVKSNALGGLALGEADDGNGGLYGWASFAGKATFREPGFDNVGNHTFVTYVEDHGDQGCNQDPADEFWIRVKDGDGMVVLEVNGPDSDPAGEDGDAAAIECGNIFVPHKTAKGKP